MRIRTYNPDTGAYDGDQDLAGRKVINYTSAQQVLISLRWFDRDYPRQTEAQIQRDVLQVIKQADILAVRLPVGGVIRQRGAGDAILQSSPMRGWPDVICVLQGGRFAGLEIKRPGGHVTTTQLGVLSDITRAGGLAAIVCSSQGGLKALLGAAPIYLLRHPGLAPIPIY
jgi:hypothetical protein